MKRIAILLAVLLVLTIATGCGGTQQTTTAATTTEQPTTVAPATEQPTTAAPTTEQATTVAPTSEQATTGETPTGETETGQATTETPTTEQPTTAAPTTEQPTTTAPTTQQPTTAAPTTQQQTTAAPATSDNVFANVNPKAPILLVSYGQSSDGAMVKALLDKTGVSHDYKQIVEPSELAGYNTIIIVPGASSKGLGAAGISPEDEIERVKNVNKSITNAMTVVVVHIGGENRRGDLSDTMIEIALEKSDAIIVVETGDLDGIFSNYAKQNSVPIESVARINDTVGSFEKLFD